MAQGGRLSEITGVAVCFADPHIPWQRGIFESTNGLLRQYLPKGSDLFRFSQAELAGVAWQLNLLNCLCQSLSTSFSIIINLLHVDLETAYV